MADLPGDLYSETADVAGISDIDSDNAVLQYEKYCSHSDTQPILWHACYRWLPYQGLAGSVSSSSGNSGAIFAGGFVMGLAGKTQVDSAHRKHTPCILREPAQSSRKTTVTHIAAAESRQSGRRDQPTCGSDYRTCASIFIRNGEGMVELYDFARDPEGLEILTGPVACSDVVERLRRRPDRIDASSGADR